MALTDHKITDSDISSKGVISAPDKLTGTAAENKAVFDRLIREAVKEKLNGLIDELVEEITAKMDAPAAMGEIGQYLRIGAGGVEWGTPAGGGDMLMSVYDQDGDGRVDEANSALTAGSTTGNAATATKLKTARTLTVKDNGQTHAGPSVSFDGSGNIILRLPTDIAANLIGAVTGNADTATKLKTARTLTVKDASAAHAGTGVSFDGSGNVILLLPSTIAAAIVGNVTGNVSGSSGSTTGNAATATKLKTARTLTVKDASAAHAGTGVSFDGSGNAVLLLPENIAAELAGNAATATKLKTARTITIKDNGQTHTGPSASFDGSGNIILRLPTDIEAALTGNVTGNADTATKLKTARNLTVKDNDESHSGGAVSFDGTSARTLKLPATIKANLEAGTIVLGSGSYGTTLPATGTAGQIFFKKV